MPRVADLVIFAVYSLITVTTIGYGDTVPCTWMGKSFYRCDICCLLLNHGDHYRVWWHGAPHLDGQQFLSVWYLLCTPRSGWPLLGTVTRCPAPGPETVSIGVISAVYSEITVTTIGYGYMVPRTWMGNSFYRCDIYCVLLDHGDH